MYVCVCRVWCARAGKYQKGKQLVSAAIMMHAVDYVHHETNIPQHNSFHSSIRAVN